MSLQKGCNALSTADSPSSEGSEGYSVLLNPFYAIISNLGANGPPSQALYPVARRADGLRAHWIYDVCTNSAPAQAQVFWTQSGFLLKLYLVRSR